jgi:predicted RNase H-like HicB family nuclease
MSSDKFFYLTMVVEANDDGYLARCADIQGAFAEGDTIEEAIFNCVDVVKMIVAYRAERNESLDKKEIKLTPEMQFSFAMPVGIG